MALHEEWEKVLRGGIVVMYAPREAVAVDPAPEGVRVERHPFCECLFVLSGTCDYFLNGEHLTLMPGTFCRIDSWIPHQYGFRNPGSGKRTDGGDGDGVCCQLWFSVHPDGIYYAFFRNCPDGSFSTLHPGGVSHEYAALYYKLAEAHDGGAPERMRLFFHLILLEIAAALRPPEDESEGEREKGMAAALKSCIRQRNGANCSLAELERIFGYSRSHLSHRFRAATGISIGEYINQVRLDYAERAARHGLKQKEIAFELGFSSPAAYWLWRQRRRREGNQLS